jgi:hypothetical protein
MNKPDVSERGCVRTVERVWAAEQLFLTTMNSLRRPERLGPHERTQRDFFE